MDDAECQESDRWGASSNLSSNFHYSVEEDKFAVVSYHPKDRVEGWSPLMSYVCSIDKCFTATTN